MERTHKTWGEKTNIFRNDSCEVSYLKLKSNQRCSWHSHKTKYNLFYVISGTLKIKTVWGIASVHPGQIFTVIPGEKHEFQTGDSTTQAIEVMYALYDPEDITRELLGGPLDEQLQETQDECGNEYWKHIGPTKKDRRRIERAIENPGLFNQ